jgi:small subunit ribosomal protein S8
MKNFLSDMLTRIRNGQRASLEAVYMHPHMPKYCYAILKILSDEGYIRGISEEFGGQKSSRQVKVLLKYTSDGMPAIEGLFSVSKPGRRIYISTNVLWKPKSSTGLFIFSTPNGIMSDREARFFNLGGEVLCGVY